MPSLKFLTLLSFCLLFPLFSATTARTTNENLLSPPSPFHALHQLAKSRPAPPLIYIPPVGLGLWQSESGSATSAVEYALAHGYHQLDGAAAYGNEVAVGKGILQSSRPRQHFWMTSKLWNSDHQPARVLYALQRTLFANRVPYLDLYLMHWPVAQYRSNNSLDTTTSLLSTWRAMESLVRQNLTRHIGVSNFSPAQLHTILSNCVICPVAHEFETHPYLQQQSFVDVHRELGLQVIAYSPLANLNPIYKSPPGMKSILDDPFWIDLAKKKNCTVAQAVLAWGMQRGTVVIPKSVHPSRIDENLAAEKIRFTEAEMGQVRKRDRKVRFNDPSQAWGVRLFEGLDGVDYS